MIKKWSLLFCFLLLICCWSACKPTLPMPMTIHPTRALNVSSAGVGVGMVNVAQDGPMFLGDNNIVAVGSGEGWVRMPQGEGQVELRAGTGYAFGSYRLQLPNVDLISGVGVSLASFPSGGRDDGQIFSLAPNAAAVYFFKDETMYVAPRVGLQIFLADRDSGLNDELFLGLAGAFGYILEKDPFVYSFEIGFGLIFGSQKLSQELWAIVPTVGVQLIDDE